MQNIESELGTAREKMQVTYEDKLIRTTADFTIETLKARRHWSNTF